MATTTSYVSVHDNNPTEGDITYYGVIKNIIELSFSEGCRNIILFECDWADNKKSKTDKHGFTLVEFTRQNKKKLSLHSTISSIASIFRTVSIRYVLGGTHCHKIKGHLLFKYQK